ncbi:MAG: hypothetical protein EAZ95_03200 [Bacteroidetes bacterium]|nr:MAG: hypothetical protein EAZ95_03200 [Bacteroidota bacterium]
MVALCVNTHFYFKHDLCPKKGNHKGCPYILKFLYIFCGVCTHAPYFSKTKQPSNMKIKQLNIENYRGFEQASITFPDNNLAVFIGANGAGKTSVLDLVASFLEDFLLGIHNYYPLQNKEINHKKGVTNEFINIINEANAKYSFGITHTNEFAFDEKDLKYRAKELHSKMFLENIELSRDITGNGLYSERQIFTPEIKLKRTKEILGNPLFSTPIFVYFQLNVTKAKRERYYSIPQLAVYEELTSNINNFAVFKAWFKQEEDFENQEKVNQENLAYRNPKLEIVRKVLETFFQKIESPVFAKMRIHRQGSKIFDFNKKFSADSLLIDKNGQPFEIERLSSGEKSLMLLVADIARRLSIANPAFSPTEALQKGEGVVLIDEIEQHLHPRWQRLVLPALQTTFPNVHFIVTTHSPQIVSSVPRESVFILDNFQIKDYKPYTQGRDSNSILQDVFGVETYPQAYKEKLHQLHQLIHDEKADQAQKLMQELISYWGENDREIKRAQLYLEDIV